MNPSSPGLAGYQQTTYSYPVPSQALRKRENDIYVTKIGLLLLIVGTVLASIPTLNVMGGVIIIVGALLTILGRKPFGDPHSRNTILSPIIYIVGGSIISLAGIGFVLAVSSAAARASAPGNFDPMLLSKSVGDAFQGLLIATAVGGVIIGIAQVFFTYALQNRTGKALLWLGFFSSLAVGVLELATLQPLIPSAESQPFIGLNSPVAFANLESQLVLLGLAGFIPAIFYVVALCLAWLRIERREIPELRPSNDSGIGSFFDDSRYFLMVFAKFMMPIVVLGLLGVIMWIFYLH